jgi:NAD-dependent SIR2 family protein deacetylase
MFNIIYQDFATCPNLVLVVGTKLRVPEVREIARSLCRVIWKADRLAIWIWYDNSPSRSTLDFLIQGDCHEIPLSLLLLGERNRASYM